jgi:hypothetical protein
MPGPYPPYPYPMGTSPAHKALGDAYQKLRLAQIEVEETLDKYIWPEDEEKKIDKSVTVMKVAFKGIKKVLARQGIGKLKKLALAI